MNCVDCDEDDVFILPQSYHTILLSEKGKAEGKCVSKDSQVSRGEKERESDRYSQQQQLQKLHALYFLKLLEQKRKRTALVFEDRM